MEKKDNLMQKALLVAGSLGLAGSSYAAGPDFTSLSTAADFGSATTAVMSVGANVVLVYIAIKGIRLILNAVKG
jgi:hypothetical protein